MNKQRKTSHILNVFQYDADGHVILPATLTIGENPHSSDNTNKIPSTAWVRTYVSGLSYQGAITLTNTGSSGAASLLSNTLNIPTYTLAGLGGEPAITAGTTAQYWRGDKSFQTLNTTVVSEGTNLYYTDARVGSYLTANNYATQSYVGTQIANLVDAAPGTLDTLNELAAALGDDPNFATTVATSIGTKQAQLNGTGFVKVSGTTVSYDNSTYLTSFIESDPIYTASSWYTTTNNASNWNIAYGWGNHASAGYLTSATAATTYVSLSGSYANPAWITSLAYSKITGVPAFLTSYTETDTLATVTARGASTSTNLSFTGILSFGSATRQMINVWGTQYGIGVQSSTQYFRSDSRFSWHRGGTHSDSQNDPGSGGAVAMTLDGSSNLSVTGTISASNFSGSSSGTNTGDQINISGNAVTTSQRSFDYLYASSYLESGGAVYGTIFYDNNDRAYYLNPAGGSRLRNLYVGDSGDDWSDPGGWGTQVRFSNGPHVRFVLHARSPGIEAGMYVHTPNQVYIGSYTAHSVNMMVGGNSRLLIEDGRVYSHVYMEAAGSMRAPIFYDSNDTGYYLDAASTSNLNQISSSTSARWGRSGMYYTIRPDKNSSNLYWTGTNGWDTQEGTWANAWKGGFSGWDIWGTGTDHPQGSGYIHAQGIISGLHYVNSDGSAAYGWMMVGAHNATDNRYWLRGKWSTNISGWVEMITSGNISSQTVSNSDMVDGYHATSFPYKASNGYYQLDNWAQFNTTAGIFWPSYNGAHLYPNTEGSYGSIRIDGTRNGWHGIYFASGNTLMMNSNESGFYRQGYGWQWRWENGTAYINKSSYGGGTSATVLDSSNYTSWAAPRNYVGDSYVDFYIYGDQNTYYPVTIHNYNNGHGFQRYSISRGYSWTAPWNPIGTGAHQGGLTFTFEWSGDIAWGGNDKSIRIIQFAESYTTMVGGMQLAHCEGIVVWLRGGGSGGAHYRLHGPGGIVQGYSINMSSWTSCAGVTYSSRSYSGSTIDSEINSRFPIRGSGTGDIYVSNNAVIHAGGGTITGDLVFNNLRCSADQSYGFIGRNVYADTVNGRGSDPLELCYYDGGGVIIGSGGSKSLTAGSVTSNGLIRVNSNTNLYLDYNHGQSIVGVYSSYRYQGVFAMGDSYKLAIDGTTPGNLYGLSWSHPNAGGQASRLNDHGLMVMINGVTQSAFSSNIWAAGDITAYSDIRVKDNIKTIDNAVQKVKAIRGVTFTRNDMSDNITRHAGVIAQEILQVLPEVVTKDGNDHYSVAYGNLNALLIEAIKEQQKQIEELQNKLDNVLSSR